MWNPDEKIKERGVLIGLDIQHSDVEIAESLSELFQLAKTAGISVKGKFVQLRSQPHAKFYVGTGKVAEIRQYIIENKLNIAIIDDEITPAQERNLEEEFGCKVIDRTRLILDIFALHASTTVGKLQVELAQMEYFLPRLRTIWHEFSRLGGGRRTTRGPGEQRIEVDRRIISERISGVRSRLEKISKQRRDLTKNRRRSFIKTVSLVGYTNSGKSSLMKAMTGADVEVADKLFATLSPTTRRLQCGKYDLLLTDTVGFIRKLPHQVVEAFNATLEQVKEADLLIHVIDVSQENYRHQIEAVEKVLGELEVLDRPIIRAYNKVDLVPDLSPGRKKGDPAPVFLSAKEKTGLDDLMNELEMQLDKLTVNIELRIPQSRQDVINLVHKRCHVVNTTYSGNDVLIECQIDNKLAPVFKEYIIDEIT